MRKTFVDNATTDKTYMQKQKEKSANNLISWINQWRLNKEVWKPNK